jgi:hypothetical protein
MSCDRSLTLSTRMIEMLVVAKALASGESADGIFAHVQEKYGATSKDGKPLARRLSASQIKAEAFGYLHRDPAQLLELLQQGIGFDNVPEKYHDGMWATVAKHKPSQLMLYIRKNPGIVPDKHKKAAWNGIDDTDKGDYLFMLPESERTPEMWASLSTPKAARSVMFRGSSIVPENERERIANLFDQSYPEDLSALYEQRYTTLPDAQRKELAYRAADDPKFAPTLLLDALQNPAQYGKDLVQMQLHFARGAPSSGLYQIAKEPEFARADRRLKSEVVDLIMQDDEWGKVLLNDYPAVVQANDPRLARYALMYAGSELDGDTKTKWALQAIVENVEDGGDDLEATYYEKHKANPTPPPAPTSDLEVTNQTLNHLLWGISHGGGHAATDSAILHGHLKRGQADDWEQLATLLERRYSSTRSDVTRIPQDMDLPYQSEVKIWRGLQKNAPETP